MITSDPARKPREGEMTENGRREYSVKAGKNLVRSELVQKISIVFEGSVGGARAGRKVRHATKLKHFNLF